MRGRNVTSAFIDGLVEAEIRRLVAKADGYTVSARGLTAEILRVYPGCCAAAELENRIIIAASKAGVPVEIGRSAGEELS
jgi:hypothetical protein